MYFASMNLHTLTHKHLRFILSLLLLITIHPYNVQAQCNVEIGGDTMICINPIYVDAGTGYDTYLWQDGSTNQGYTITTPGIYDVLVETTGQTIVVNGHFEAGNVGFISSYVYNATSLWNEGTFWVGDNANTVHSNFQGIDHTPGAGVNFLIVNGSNTPGLIVWGQTITVTQNTDYKFSAWVCSVHPSSPAQLQFAINNITQGTTFSAPSTINTWTQFFIVWNSGMTTTANISIINQNIGGGGNDFGIDDISFRPVLICSDTILVSPNDLTVIPTGINVLCAGEASGGATLNVTGGYTPYTYLWSNNTTQPTLDNVFSGTYTVTVSDATDCEATATVIVSEPASVVSGSLQITPVTCFGENTGAINLTPSGGSNPYTYHWSTGSHQEDVENLAAGNYNVSITDNNGCEVVETVEVTQPDLLNIAISGTDLACHGDTNAFAGTLVTGGTPDYIYNWSTGAYTSGITNLSAGTYSVTVTDINQCEASNQITFSEPAPIQIYTSPDKTICLSNETNILATSVGGTTPYNYHWMPGGYAAPSILVSPHEDTEYCVYVSDTNNCVSDTRCITVFVNPPLEFELEIDDDTICKGDTIHLISTVSGGNNGPYFLQLYDGPIIHDWAVFSPESSQKYVVVASDGCGTPQVADTVYVEVFDQPTVSFRSKTLDGCQPLDVQFLLNYHEYGDRYFWDFDDSHQLNLSTVAEPIHTFLNHGEYDITLKVVNIAGCSAEHTEYGMIKVYESPISNFTYSPESAPIVDPVIHFTNQSEGAFMSLWNFGDGDSIVSQQPGEHVYDEIGKFLVSLITESSNGCRDTAFQWVSIEEINTFYAPNALNPYSGYSENRIFKPSILNLKEDSYQLFIYTRWGELLFQTTNYEAGWDGRIDHELVKAGSYVWLVRYKDQNDKSFQKTGTVTLVY